MYLVRVINKMLFIRHHVLFIYYLMQQVSDLHIHVRQSITALQFLEL